MGASRNLLAKLLWQATRVSSSADAPSGSLSARPWHWYFTSPEFGFVVQLGIALFLLAVAGLLMLLFDLARRPPARRGALIMLASLAVILGFFIFSARKEWFYRHPRPQVAWCAAACAMGVDLGELCPGRPITIASLEGKILALDAFNMLYQFLSIIRGPDGTPLKDDQGRVTSHLNGLLNRTANLTAAGIYPAFVFDGPHHPLKARTVEERQRIRREARTAMEAAIQAGDLETARSKASQSSTLTGEMIEQAKRLVRAMGLPVVQAPGEGEAQASFMARQGQAYACGSQDFDALLFGTPHLVRNLSVTGRRRMPGRQAFVEVPPEEIDLDASLRALQITREQLVDVALLVGTDYNAGIIGIGPKTALKVVRDCGDLETALDRCWKETGTLWTKLRAGREALGDLDTLRKLFLDPAVERTVKIEWGRVDRDAIEAQLVAEHRFNPERVRSALEKLATAPIYRRQKALSDWS